jgi:Holliday junction DNA helicase RuvB
VTDDRIVNPIQQPEDNKVETTLRPKSLCEYIGQTQVKNNLEIFLTAAKQRKESLEHVLLHGGPGLGKTTLAYIIAQEMGTNIRITSGPALERVGDLAAILTNLQAGDILFIDEIHRLHKTIEEVLYPAMEDYAIDVVLGKGPSARTLRLDIPRFTILGATTRLSMLSAPLRDRFGVQFKLNFYALAEMEKIVERSAKILKMNLEPAAKTVIANRARSTPRIANRLLKRVRDYAQVKTKHTTISAIVAEQALAMLDIDELGLDNIDRRLLHSIITTFHGGPVGIQTLAATLGEDLDTLETVYEPFLLQLGFLARTPRGRIATSAAYKHLQLASPAKLLV